jgi:hypothetical protein
MKKFPFDRKDDVAGDLLVAPTTSNFRFAGGREKTNETIPFDCEDDVEGDRPVAPTTITLSPQ